MKTPLALLLMLFCLALVGFGQSNPSAQPDITPIKFKTKVFVNESDKLSRKIITEALLKDKKLKVAENAEKAHFIVEYETQKGRIGNLIVYSYNQQKQKVIYWAETKALSARLTVALIDNQKALVESFLKVKNSK